MQITLAVRVQKAKLDEVIEKIPGAVDMATSLAADGIVTKAQGYAPVRTGALRDGIHKEGGGGDYFVTTSVPYGGYQEWGTRYMAAHPYLRPAAEGYDWTDVVRAFFRWIGL